MEGLEGMGNVPNTQTYIGFLKGYHIFVKPLVNHREDKREEREGNTTGYTGGARNYFKKGDILVCIV